MTEPATIEPHIAVVSDYDGLIEALRARKDQLGLTDKAIDALTLLPDGYTGKLFGAARIKNIGPQSMGPLLDVLCAKIIIIPDMAGLERLARRRANLENNGQKLRPTPNLSRLSLRAIERFLPDVAREMSRRGSSKGGKASLVTMTPTARSRRARRASRARWKWQRLKRRSKPSADQICK